MTKPPQRTKPSYRRHVWAARLWRCGARPRRCEVIACSRQNAPFRAPTPPCRLWIRPVGSCIRCNAFLCAFRWQQRVWGAGAARGSAAVHCTACLKRYEVYACISNIYFSCTLCFESVPSVRQVVCAAGRTERRPHRLAPRRRVGCLAHLRCVAEVARETLLGYALLRRAPT